MLTSTGPNLLDFGLAKPWLPALWPQYLADTVSDLGLTKEGTVLGAVPYMSPEALEGRELTSASDVFAFGAVLFEMVIGRRAFDGSSGAQIIAGILAERRPSISSVRPELPQALDRLVARCLARNPADRPASMREVADELEKIGATPVGPTRLKTVYPKWTRPPGSQRRRGLHDRGRCPGRGSAARSERGPRRDGGGGVYRWSTSRHHYDGHYLKRTQPTRLPVEA